MKHIAIVGAGQSGLLLAIGLLKNGFNVSLYNQQTEEQIINGRIRSSQAIFHSALEIERKFGLNFWEDSCPKNHYLTLRLLSPDQKSNDIQWEGKLNHPFQSVDQRIKLFSWIKEFKRLGGHFHIKDIDNDDLKALSENHDLVIAANGKGSLRNQFLIDAEKNTFTQPMRHLSLVYVKGMTPSKHGSVKINIIPGIGEYFTLNGLTHNGPCEMMLFEGVPGSDIAELSTITDAASLAIKGKVILKKYLPEEYKRCENIYPTDDKAYLTGSITPTVRKPLLHLANGKTILGMGDCIILNDPISGQGANAAIRCADIYLKEILAHEGDYSSPWMQRTFNKYWDYAQWPVMWSNMLLQQPKPHILKLLQEAQHSQSLANYIANGFDTIVDLMPILKDPHRTNQLIEAHMQNSRSSTIELNILLKKNNEHLKQFQSNQLMQLIHSDAIQDKSTRDSTLDYLQIFSDAFQKMVMQRAVSTTDPLFSPIAEQHLQEEFGHHLILRQNRNNRPTPHDAIIQENSEWFIKQMHTADDSTKHILMHLILEATADMFFKAAYEAFKPYEEISYLQLHDEADEEHAEMGVTQLASIELNNENGMLDLYEEGWKRLNAICDHIAKISCPRSPIKTSYRNKPLEA